jgi:hypothetical protein
MGIKGEPSIGDAVGLSGNAFELKVASLRLGLTSGQHVTHRLMPVLGADIPRKRHQVAPVTVSGEQGHYGVGLVPGKRLPKLV